MTHNSYNNTSSSSSSSSSSSCSCSCHVQILNIGSINIDDVFIVPHIASSGETISSISYKQLPGGKGANQTIALARAQPQSHNHPNNLPSVFHFGKVGRDGMWLVDLMKENHVDVSLVIVDDHHVNYLLLSYNISMWLSNFIINLIT